MSDRSDLKVWKVLSVFYLHQQKQKQCDQMAILFVQFLVICNDEKLPNITSKFFAKVVQNFAKYKINTCKIAFDFSVWPKWTKFGQIWSHWPPEAAAATK